MLYSMSVLHICINSAAYTLLDINIPIKYVWTADIVISAAITSLLAFIFYYLFRFRRHAKRRRQLTNSYSEFISEIIICVSEDELRQVLSQPSVHAICHSLKKPLARNILSRELMMMHKGMSGTAAENLRWLYNYLQLEKDPVAALSSPRWNRKANAIQELAEMKQEKYLAALYRETNNKNTYVRTEAQIAVVKLTGFDGLCFLDDVTYPVSQWQQIRLLQQLSLQTNFRWDMVPNWLTSQNETVIELALRLVAAYQRYEFYDMVTSCMEHPSKVVRSQAIQTLREIARPETASLLQQQFSKSKKEEQLNILSVMEQVGTEKQLDFLTSLLSVADTDIHNSARNAILQINPNQIKTNIKEVA